MRTAEEVQKKIADKIPPGSIIPAHDERGHFYSVPSLGEELLPSVTSFLHFFKDESLMRWMMHCALDHVFAHWREFTEENVMDHLNEARFASSRELKDAGSIGSLIHDARADYFRDWIANGVKPELDARSYLTEPIDLRAVSAMRALDLFIKERDYEPIATELPLWSDKLKIAGTLDDVGMMKLDEKRRGMVILDLKSSNTLKPIHSLQVALYVKMFIERTGLRPRGVYLLRVSKENGSYELEEVRNVARIGSLAIKMISLVRGMEALSETRKANKKKTIKV